MRPRVGIANRESHGQTVRVGRSVSVLKIPLVHADSVSKSLRENFFFFSRERPLLARGTIIQFASIAEGNSSLFRTLLTSHVLHNSMVHAKA